MAPLLPNSTARVWVDYTTCGEQHSCMIRYKEPATVADVLTAFNSLTSAVSTLMNEAEVTNVRQAAALSNFSFPVGGTWPVGWGGDPGPHHASANMLNFISRSADGRMGRVQLFGCFLKTDDTDYRLSSAQSSQVEAALAVLEAATNVFVTINGFDPTWYQYANIGPHAYWRNRIR